MLSKFGHNSTSKKQSEKIIIPFNTTVKDEQEEKKPITTTVPRQTHDKRTTDARQTHDQQTIDARPTTDRPTTDDRPTIDQQTIDDRPPTDRRTTNDRPTIDQPKPNYDLNDPVWLISDHKAIILGYYIHQEHFLVNKQKLKNSTGIISNSTIRDALITLIKYRFFSKPQRYKNLGSIYTLNEDLCNKFLSNRWCSIIEKYNDPPNINNAGRKTIDQHTTDDRLTIDRRTTDDRQTIDQRTTDDKGRLISKSVSSLNKNLLTTKIETDPDLEYWKQKDLPVKKIISWIQEFNLTEEQILNQLRYCAFEWKNKTEQEVQKPLGKFYISLKAGGFAKPTGYKTPEEKRLEVLNAENEIRKQVLEDIKKAKQEAENLEFAIWVENLTDIERKTIINNSKLSPKQKAKGEGPVVETVFKEKFKSLKK